MLLTIAIPTYNRAESLRITLQGFMAEIERCRLREIEIVVSDNCSTDNTQVVCTSLADTYPNVIFKYFRNSSNLGFDGNVNALFNYAEGKYVWTFSDDDQIEHEVLTHVSHLLKQRDVLFAFANYQVEVDGQIIPSRFGTGANQWLKSDQLLKHIRFSNSLISSCIFSRTIWLKAKPERFIGTQWIHFFIAREILNQGEALIIGRTLFTMKQSGLQKSRSEKRIENSDEIEFYMLAHLKFVEFASQLNSHTFDAETIEMADALGKTEDIRQIVNFKLTTPKYSMRQLVNTWKKMAEFRKYNTRFWIIATPLIFTPSWTIKILRLTHRLIKSCLQ